MQCISLQASIAPASQSATTAGQGQPRSRRSATAAAAAALVVPAATALVAPGTVLAAGQVALENARGGASGGGCFVASRFGDYAAALVWR